MRFKLRNRGDNWSFDLVSDTDQTILNGTEFESRDDVVQAIRNTIAGMRIESNYVQNEDGTYSITDGNNVIATSSPNAPNANALREQATETTDFPVDFTTTTTTTTTTRRKLNKELPKPPSLAEMAVLYVVTRSSKSGAAGPELFEDDGMYWWHFNNDAGTAIIYGRGLENGSKRKTNVRSALRYGTKEKYYDLEQENGKYYFVIRTPNKFEIVRSAMFDNEADRKAAMEYFMANADKYKADFTKATRKQKLNAQEYVFDYASKSGKSGFETFKNEDNKKYYFHLNDNDGKALLFSQGYRGGKPRDTGMRSVIKNGNIRERYRVKERDGKFYVVLLAANNQEIARSKPLDKEADGEVIITYILGLMPSYAKEYGVELVTEKQTVTETDTFNIAMETPAPEPAKKKEKNDNYMPCSAYVQEAGEVGFHKFLSEKNEHHFFSYNTAAGDTVWRSEGYTTIAARDNGIESVEKNAPVEGRITRHKTKSGKFFAKLKAGNHQEIARTCYFDDEKELAFILAPFMEKYGLDVDAVLGEMFADWGTWRTEMMGASDENSQIVDDYLECEAYKQEAGPIGFHKFLNEKDNNHYFSYNDENGATIWRSEGYTATAARDNGIESVKKNAPIEGRIQIHKTDEGLHYATIKAGNHQEIARTCLFENEKDLALLLAPFMQNHGVDANLVLGAMFAGWAGWRSDWGWWKRKEEKEAEELRLAAAKAEEEARLALAAEEEKRKLEERKKAMDVDNYLPCKEYKIGKGYREFKQNNQYYFTFNDEKGNVVLRSEGYNKVAARNKGRDWVKRQMKDEKNYVKKSTAAGKHYFALMANKDTEIARSCYYDTEAAMLAAMGGLLVVPKPKAAAAVATAAVAGAAIAATKKAEQKKATPVTAKAAAAAPVESSGGGGWWKWLLGLLLLLLLLWLLRGCDGCNGCGEKAAITPVPTEVEKVVEPTLEEPTPEPEPVKSEPVINQDSIAAANIRASHPVFAPCTSANKVLTRLGTNPEFGNCANLDTNGFYNKLKGAYNQGNTHKEFLDTVLKGIGLKNGFADLKPNMITSTRVPAGTVGNMGRGTNHRTGCVKLNASGNDLNAFRINGKWGQSINFMKTCGNHFYTLSK